MLKNKIILKKTVLVGFSTLISRFFGIIREILMVKYLGASGLSDAFLTAYKIPNSLRKIFAEGALSAAFIPTISRTLNQGNQQSISGLMSLGLLFFEGLVIALCILIMYNAPHIINFIAPGFSALQVEQAVPMVHILTPLIFFISSGALLASALQATNHFFIPAFAPIVLNIIFIIGIYVCLLYNFPVTTLCWFIFFAGVVHLLLHIANYMYLQFSLSIPTKNDFKIFTAIVIKFLLCLPSISLMEIALFIDTSFASLLKPGSISLLFYANRFVGIPIGVFAVAFSTILLPHFSRVTISNPKRLHFYLLESTKFIFWVTTPVALLMGFFSKDIFSTIFLSKNFTLEQVQEAGNILITFLWGLFSFSLNKILLNIFYSMQAAWIPAIIALCATAINIVLNMLFITQLKTIGLALATTISSIIQTLLFILILYKKYQFRLYPQRFMLFITSYAKQLFLFGIFFIGSYYCLTYLLMNLPPQLSSFLLYKTGMWLWVGPLAGICLIMIWYTRHYFGIKIFFLG